MADILLIYPKPHVFKKWRFGFSLNLLYLSALLKKANHHIVDLVDYSVEDFNQERLNNYLKSTDIIIIEFDSFPLKRSINIDNAEYLIDYIKTKFGNKKIIAFGYDLILFPRAIKGSDFTYNFEPEKSIVNVVNLLSEEKDNFNHPMPEPLDNLDDLPFPDRSLLSDFLEHGGTVKHKPNLAKSTLIQTSRGCRNSCIFCQRKGWYNQFRVHSIDYVIEEFTELQKNHYVNIWISDDNFTFDLKRAKEILIILIDKQLTENMKISLSSWTNIDLEFLEIAKKANVSIISYGIESADREILDFYKKHIDLSKTKDLIHFANDIGLYSVGNFIIGAPMETEQTIQKTFDYILEIPFDELNLKVLDYMAGSELYDHLPQLLKNHKRHLFACKENGLNQFPLDFIKQKINEFQNIFRKNRKGRLEKKLLGFGPPYILRNSPIIC